MKCKKKKKVKTFVQKSYTYFDCGEFLFIDHQFEYKESVKICKHRKSELAKINIRSIEVNDISLNKVINQDSTFSYFRIGLRLKKQSGKLYGKWSNNEDYGPLPIEEFLFYKDQNSNCFDAVINKKTKNIILFKCDTEIKFAALCRKQRKKLTTDYNFLNTSTTKVTTKTDLDGKTYVPDNFTSTNKSSGFTHLLATTASKNNFDRKSSTQLVSILSKQPKLLRTMSLLLIPLQLFHPQQKVLKT